MLVLSRKAGESVIMDIGGLEVEIIYDGLNEQGEARLVFAAPNAVRIIRSEIVRRDQHGRITR